MTTQILPDEEVIANSDLLLTFTAYDENGAVINLKGGKVFWYLSPAGDTDETILEKQGTLTDPVNGEFTVFIDNTDTVGLEGEYEQQIMVFDSNTVRVVAKIIRRWQYRSISSPDDSSSEVFVKWRLYEQKIYKNTRHFYTHRVGNGRFVIYPSIRVVKEV